MAKEKNPYEIEQFVLELNKNAELLESASEKELKELKEKIASAYKTARKERLQKQKVFAVAYRNIRELTVSLKEKVSNAEVSPEKAVKEIVDFANSDELTFDTENSEEEE